jgi:hypothetical protein
MPKPKFSAVFGLVAFGSTALWFRFVDGSVKPLIALCSMSRAVLRSSPMRPLFPSLASQSAVKARGGNGRSGAVLTNAITNSWFTGVEYRYSQYETKAFVYPIPILSSGLIGLKQELGANRVCANNSEQRNLLARTGKTDPSDELIQIPRCCPIGHLPTGAPTAMILKWGVNCCNDKDWLESTA